MSLAEYRDKGNKALQAGDFDGAIEFFTKTIELDSSNHINFSNRACAYLGRNEPLKALDDADMCIDINPSFAKGYSRKGAAYLMMKQYNSAIETYEEGLKHIPTNISLKTELKAAIEAKQANIENINPLAVFLNTSFFLNLLEHPIFCEKLSDSGFLDKIKSFRKSPDVIFSDPEMMELAQILVGGSENETVFTQLAELDDSYANEDERFLTDEEKQEKASKIKSRDLMRTSLAFFQEKKFLNALATMKEAYEADRWNLMCLNHEIAIYIELDNYEKAVEICSILLERSHELEREKAVKKALQAREKYSISETRMSLLLGRGRHLMRDGEMKSALDYFDKAYQLCEDKIETATNAPFLLNEVRLNLAEYWLELGHVGKAQEYCLAALEWRLDSFGGNHPLVAECFHILARVHFYQGNFTQTMKLTEKALLMTSEALEHQYAVQEDLTVSALHILHMKIMLVRFSAMKKLGLWREGSSFFSHLQNYWKQLILPSPPSPVHSPGKTTSTFTSTQRPGSPTSPAINGTGAPPMTTTTAAAAAPGAPGTTSPTTTSIFQDPLTWSYKYLESFILYFQGVEYWEAGRFNVCLEEFYQGWQVSESFLGANCLHTHRLKMVYLSYLFQGGNVYLSDPSPSPWELLISLVPCFEGSLSSDLFSLLTTLQCDSTVKEESNKIHDNNLDIPEKPGTWRSPFDLMQLSMLILEGALVYGYKEVAYLAKFSFESIRAKISLTMNVTNSSSSSSSSSDQEAIIPAREAFGLFGMPVFMSSSLLEAKFELRIGDPTQCLRCLDRVNLILKDTISRDNFPLFDEEDAPDMKSNSLFNGIKSSVSWVEFILLECQWLLGETIVELGQIEKARVVLESIFQRVELLQRQINTQLQFLDASIVWEGPPSWIVKQYLLARCWLLGSPQNYSNAKTLLQEVGVKLCQVYGAQSIQVSENLHWLAVYLLQRGKFRHAKAVWGKAIGILLLHQGLYCTGSSAKLSYQISPNLSFAFQICVRILTGMTDNLLFPGYFSDAKLAANVSLDLLDKIFMDVSSPSSSLSTSIAPLLLSGQPYNIHHANLLWHSQSKILFFHEDLNDMAQSLLVSSWEGLHQLTSETSNLLSSLMGIEGQSVSGIGIEKENECYSSLQMLLMLAEVLATTQNTSLALALNARVRVLCGYVLGEGSALEILAHFQLAQLLFSMGRVKEALNYLTSHVLSDLESYWGKSHPYCLYAKGMIAMAMNSLKSGAAKTLLTSCYKSLATYSFFPFHADHSWMMTLHQALGSEKGDWDGLVEASKRYSIASSDSSRRRGEGDFHPTEVSLNIEAGDTWGEVLENSEENVQDNEASQVSGNIRIPDWKALGNKHPMLKEVIQRDPLSWLPKIMKSLLGNTQDSSIPSLMESQYPSQDKKKIRNLKALMKAMEKMKLESLQGSSLEATVKYFWPDLNIDIATIESASSQKDMNESVVASSKGTTMVMPVKSVQCQEMSTQTEDYLLTEYWQALLQGEGKEIIDSSNKGNRDGVDDANDNDNGMGNGEEQDHHTQVSSLENSDGIENETMTLSQDLKTSSLMDLENTSSMQDPSMEVSAVEAEISEDNAVDIPEAQNDQTELPLSKLSPRSEKKLEASFFLLERGQELWKAGQFARSQVILEESRLVQEVIQAQSLEYATILLWQGKAFSQLLKHNEAKEAFEHCHKLRLQFLEDRHHASLGEVLVAQGQDFYLQDRLEESLHFLHEGLKRLELPVGSKDNQNNNAVGTPEELQQQLILKQRKVEVGNVYCFLSRVNLSLSCVKEAQSWAEQGFAQLQKAASAKTADIATGLLAKAEVYLMQGKFVEMKTMLEQAFYLRKNYLVTNHPLLAEVGLILGQSLLGQGHATEAMARFKQGVEILTSCYGSSDPRTMQAWALVAKVLTLEGKFSAALRIVERLSRLREKIFLPPTLSLPYAGCLLESWLNLADIHRNLAEYDLCHQYLQKVEHGLSTWHNCQAKNWYSVYERKSQLTNVDQDSLALSFEDEFSEETEEQRKQKALADQCTYCETTGTYIPTTRQDLSPYHLEFLWQKGQYQIIMGDYGAVPATAQQLLENSRQLLAQSQSWYSVRALLLLIESQLCRFVASKGTLASCLSDAERNLRKALRALEKLSGLENSWEGWKASLLQAEYLQHSKKWSLAKQCLEKAIALGRWLYPPEEIKKQVDDSEKGKKSSKKRNAKKKLSRLDEKKEDPEKDHWCVWFSRYQEAWLGVHEIATRYDKAEVEEKVARQETTASIAVQDNPFQVKEKSALENENNPFAVAAKGQEIHGAAQGLAQEIQGEEEKAGELYRQQAAEGLVAEVLSEEEMAGKIEQRGAMGLAKEITEEEEKMGPSAAEGLAQEIEGEEEKEREFYRQKAAEGLVTEILKEEELAGQVDQRGAVGLAEEIVREEGDDGSRRSQIDGDEASVNSLDDGDSVTLNLRGSVGQEALPSIYWIPRNTEGVPVFDDSKYQNGMTFLHAMKQWIEKHLGSRHPWVGRLTGDQGILTLLRFQARGKFLSCLNREDRFNFLEWEQQEIQNQISQQSSMAATEIADGAKEKSALSPTEKELEEEEEDVVDEELEGGSSQPKKFERSWFLELTPSASSSMMDQDGDSSTSGSTSSSTPGLLQIQDGLSQLLRFSWDREHHSWLVPLTGFQVEVEVPLDDLNLARQICGRGYESLWGGDFAGAVQRFEDALSMWVEKLGEAAANQQEGVARLLAGQGLVHYRSGQYNEAKEYWKQSLGVWTRLAWHRQSQREARKLVNRHSSESHSSGTTSSKDAALQGPFSLGMAWAKLGLAEISYAEGQLEDCLLVVIQCQKRLSYRFVLLKLQQLVGHNVTAMVGNDSERENRALEVSEIEMLGSIEDNEDNYNDYEEQDEDELIDFTLEDRILTLLEALMLQAKALLSRRQFVTAYEAVLKAQQIKTLWSLLLEREGIVVGVETDENKGVPASSETMEAEKGLASQQHQRSGFYGQDEVDDIGEDLQRPESSWMSLEEGGDQGFGTSMHTLSTATSLQGQLRQNEPEGKSMTGDNIRSKNSQPSSVPSKSISLTSELKLRWQAFQGQFWLIMGSIELHAGYLPSVLVPAISTSSSLSPGKASSSLQNSGWEVEKRLRRRKQTREGGDWKGGLSALGMTHLQKGLDSLKAAFGDQHYLTAEAMVRWSEGRLKRGQLFQAKKVVFQAFKLQMKIYGTLPSFFSIQKSKESSGLSMAEKLQVQAEKEEKLKRKAAKKNGSGTKKVKKIEKRKVLKTVPRNSLSSLTSYVIVKDVADSEDVEVEFEEDVEVEVEVEVVSENREGESKAGDDDGDDLDEDDESNQVDPIDQAPNQVDPFSLQDVVASQGGPSDNASMIASLRSSSQEASKQLLDSLPTYKAGRNEDVSYPKSYMYRGRIVRGHPCLIETLLLKSQICRLLGDFSDALESIQASMTMVEELAHFDVVSGGFGTGWDNQGEVVRKLPEIWDSYFPWLKETSDRESKDKQKNQQEQQEGHETSAEDSNDWRKSHEKQELERKEREKEDQEWNLKLAKPFMLEIEYEKSKLLMVSGSPAVAQRVFRRIFEYRLRHTPDLSVYDAASTMSTTHTSATTIPVNRLFFSCYPLLACAYQLTELDIILGHYSLAYHSLLTILAPGFEHIFGHSFHLKSGLVFLAKAQIEMSWGAMENGRASLEMGRSIVTNFLTASSPLVRMGSTASNTTSAAMHPLLIESDRVYAEYLCQASEFLPAVALADHAVSRATSSLGPESMTTLYCQRTRARIALEQGQSTAAKRQFEQCVAGLRSKIGKKHYQTLITLVDLGSCYLMECQFSIAQPIFLRASQLLRRELGRQHWEVGRCMTFMAQCLRGGGKLVEARETAIEVLKLFQAESVTSFLSTTSSGTHSAMSSEPSGTLGSSAITALSRSSTSFPHFHVSQILHELGEVSWAQGKMDEASQFFEQALTHRRLLWPGRLHRYLADSYEALGRIEMHKGQYGDSRSYHERAYAMRLKVFASSEAEINYFELVSSKKKLNKKKQSTRTDASEGTEVNGNGEDLSSSILDGGNGNGGTPLIPHLSLASSQFYFAMLLYRIGQVEMARAKMERALEAGRSVCGRRHLWVAEVLTVLGQILHTLGDYLFGFEVLMEAYRLRDQILVDYRPHYLIGESLVWLGENRRLRGYLEVGLSQGLRFFAEVTEDEKSTTIQDKKKAKKTKEKASTATMGSKWIHYQFLEEEKEQIESNRSHFSIGYQALARKILASGQGKPEPPKPSSDITKAIMKKAMAKSSSSTLGGKNPAGASSLTAATNHRQFTPEEVLRQQKELEAEIRQQEQHREETFHSESGEPSNFRAMNLMDQPLFTRMIPTDEVEFLSESVREEGTNLDSEQSRMAVVGTGQESVDETCGVDYKVKTSEPNEKREEIEVDDELGDVNDDLSVPSVMISQIEHLEAMEARRRGTEDDTASHEADRDEEKEEQNPDKEVGDPHFHFAMPLFMEALEIFEAAFAKGDPFPLEHYVVLPVFRFVASTMLDLGHLTLSWKLSAHTLQITRRLYGDHHLETAFSMVSLAQSLLSWGKYQGDWNLGTLAIPELKDGITETGDAEQGALNASSLNKSSLKGKLKLKSKDGSGSGTAYLGPSLITHFSSVLNISPSLIQKWSPDVTHALCEQVAVTPSVPENHLSNLAIIAQAKSPTRPVKKSDLKKSSSSNVMSSAASSSTVALRKDMKNQVSGAKAPPVLLSASMPLIANNNGVLSQEKSPRLSPLPNSMLLGKDGKEGKMMVEGVRSKSPPKGSTMGNGHGSGSGSGITSSSTPPPPLGFMGYAFPSAKPLLKSKDAGVTRPAVMEVDNALWLLHYALRLVRKALQSFQSSLHHTPVLSVASSFFVSQFVSPVTSLHPNASGSSSTSISMDHPLIAEIWFELGRLACSLDFLDLPGEFLWAFHTKALDMKSRLYPRIHPSLAASYSALASLLYRSSKIAHGQSYRIASQSLRWQIFLPLHASLHPFLAQSWKEEGRELGMLGDFFDAHQRYLQVLTSQLPMLGPWHFEVADSLVEWAMVEFNLGRNSLALQKAECALEVVKWATRMEMEDSKSVISGLSEHALNSNYFIRHFALPPKLVTLRIQIFLLMGRIYRSQGDWEASFHCLQEGQKSRKMLDSFRRQDSLDSVMMDQEMASLYITRGLEHRKLEEQKSKAQAMSGVKIVENNNDMEPKQGDVEVHRDMQKNLKRQEKAQEMESSQKRSSQDFRSARLLLLEIVESRRRLSGFRSTYQGCSSSNTSSSSSNAASVASVAASPLGAWSSQTDMDALATSLSLLSTVHRYLGMYDEAGENLEEVLSILEKQQANNVAISSSSPTSSSSSTFSGWKISECWHNIGFLLSEKQQYTASAAAYEKGIAGKQACLTQHWIQELQSEAELKSKDDFASQKETKDKKAITKRIREWGTYLSSLASSIHNLAGIYHRLGQFDRAESLYIHSYRLFMREFQESDFPGVDVFQLAQQLKVRDSNQRSMKRRRDLPYSNDDENKESNEIERNKKELAEDIDEDDERKESALSRSDQQAIDSCLKNLKVLSYDRRRFQDIQKKTEKDLHVLEQWKPPQSIKVSKHLSKANAREDSPDVAAKSEVPIGNFNDMVIRQNYRMKMLGEGLDSIDLDSQTSSIPSLHRPYPSGYREENEKLYDNDMVYPTEKGPILFHPLDGGMSVESSSSVSSAWDPHYWNTNGKGVPSIDVDQSFPRDSFRVGNAESSDMDGSSRPQTYGTEEVLNLKFF